mgnify:FL=1
MENTKKYYKDINLIRLLACISVFLYHLGILKGGYLAVCTFFVLSGYLTCIKALSSDKFSFKEYFKNRILKLYVPLITIVFISIAVLSFFQNIFLLNLKPETTSVLLGYNNFWQISANLDYFARHIDSPFMHLWYISILLQLDLIFPFIFILLRKIGEKVNKIIPCIITFILGLASAIAFCVISKDSMMFSYYNTFTRAFSYIFGVFIAFVHHYFKAFIPFKIKDENNCQKFIYFYSLLLIALFVIGDASSSIHAISMVIVSLISCRLIDYSVQNTDKLDSKDKLIKSITSLCYEFYLVQYPVIFIFQYITINYYLKLILIFVITLLIAFLIHICLFKKKKNIFVRIIKVILILVVFYGIYQFIITKDHAAEMQKLKEQLKENEKTILVKQEEYEQELKKQEEDWTKLLSEAEITDEKLTEIVSNLPVVFIGDSVMLGAKINIQKQFPKSYFDAKVSRSTWKGIEVIQELKNNNMLGNPVVIHLGTNGDCSKTCKKSIMDLCEDREVFWLNTSNLVNVNENLTELAKEYSNLHIIDWYQISKDHPEYFYADGIHLPETGRKVYTEAIYKAIYSTYQEIYKTKKETMIKAHEEELKNKISFYGNDVLFYAFDIIHENFQDDNFFVDKDYTFKKLKEKITKAIDEKSLTNKIVLALDNTMKMSTKDYMDLIKLCSDKKVYILFINKPIEELEKKENVEILNFSEEIEKHKEYLMTDEIHLTEEGNKALSEFLKEKLSK